MGGWAGERVGWLKGGWRGSSTVPSKALVVLAVVNRVDVCALCREDSRGGKSCRAGRRAPTRQRLPDQRRQQPQHAAAAKVILVGGAPGGAGRAQEHSQGRRMGRRLYSPGHVSPLR